MNNNTLNLMSRIQENDKDDVNKWITRLHFEPEQKVREFEITMRIIAETFAQAESVPFENQRSQDITSKLERISKTLTKTVSELKHLKIYDGQDLETSPANYPVHLAIDNAYDERCNHNGTASEVARRDIDRANSGIVGWRFVTSRIEEMEEFLDCVNRARRNTSRRGNSVSRNRKATIKSMLSKNFVFQYRSTFGFFPTERKDIVEVLGWVFQMAGLTDLNAVGSLRTAIENDQNWLGGKDSEIVQSLTKKKILPE